jgi:saccharopine dehydrogenase-like NADP-dependent oxidoreductase
LAEPPASLTILILGGYGVFGGRLARLLADDARLALIIAGRSLAKASSFCTELQGKARITPLAFDRDGDVSRQLGEAKPDMLVDASGPFQAYGEDPYRVVRAAIGLGIDYLDLADGSAFVEGIGAFDDEARPTGVFALSGVSTCPALTAAVVRRLAQGMARLDRVTAGIAPSPHARVGVNVLRAVASYAGRRIRLTREGARTTGFALTETRRFTIAPPGHLPLESRVFSLVDVPDLEILPRLWPSLRNVWFGMGPTPAFLHRIFILLARLVRLRLLPDIGPLAPMMHGVLDKLRFGPHRGGMFVKVEGLGSTGEKRARSWHMVAEGDDGPFIPSMAAAAIISRCLEGRRPEAGARHAAREVELADYEAFFAKRAIFNGIREDGPGENRKPLYRRLLSSSFDLLPLALRQMHDIGAGLSAKGEASVERGSGFVPRLICMVFGLPKDGNAVPVEVSFEQDDGGEVWRRNFAGKRFASRQAAGTGRSDGLLRERFGPFGFALALVVADDRLTLVPRRWSLFGIPLPQALGEHDRGVDRDLQILCRDIGLGAGKAHAKVLGV